MKTTLRLLTLALLLFGGRARADLDSLPAIYLIGGLDGRMLTNQDATNYFNRPTQFGPGGLPSGVLHLGLQLGRWVSLEVSGQGGPVRDFDVSYENGIFGTTRRVITHWELTTYSITPGLCWAGPNYSNMLGLRVGQASLKGSVRDDQYGAQGSYQQAAQAYDLGVIFRSQAIAVGHLSIGIEGGYDWTMFNSITNSNGTGSYDPVHSPERNISGIGHGGDQTVLDFSGAHVAVIIGLWTNPPVVRDGGSDLE